jgi:hypothetical protein
LRTDGASELTQNPSLVSFKSDGRGDGASHRRRCGSGETNKARNKGRAIT